MAFNVGEWNCVVAGAWNPAVLTPNGVSRHLLRLAPDTPVMVQINVEQAQAPRVRHDGLVVVVDFESLVAAPEVATVANLRRATGVLRAGLDALDQTPVRAAGVNFKYVNDDPSALLDERRSPLDERLEGTYTIAGRTFKRALSRPPGVINVEIREENAILSVDLNFHRDSTDHHELSAWLDLVEQFHVEATNLLEVLGVNLVDQA